MRVLCIFILIILLNNSLQASEKSAIMVGTLVENYARGVSIPVNPEELECLTNSLYKEAEVKIVPDDLSMIMIAQVVLNRTVHKRFPSTPCKVIKQKIKGYCIFSYYCLRGHSYMPDAHRYSIARKVAYNALQGHYKGITPALFYKRCEVKDKWFKKNTIFIKQIRSHCFYVYR